MWHPTPIYVKYNHVSPCIVLHCIVLYGIALHFIALHCVVLPCFVLHNYITPLWESAASVTYSTLREHGPTFCCMLPHAVPCDQTHVPRCSVHAGLRHVQLTQSCQRDHHYPKQVTGWHVSVCGKRSLELSWRCHELMDTWCSLPGWIPVIPAWLRVFISTATSYCRPSSDITVNTHAVVFLCVGLKTLCHCPKYSLITAN